MDNPDLDRLIVENIADLDASARRIEAMAERVWEAQAETLKAWCTEKGWLGDLDPTEDLSVWPSYWAVDGKPQAFFRLGYGENDDDLAHQFDLTRLVGAAGGRVCLWLEYAGLRNPWKATVRPRAEALQEHDFLMTPYANFYTDCTPTVAEMADGFEQGDFSAPMSRVRRALDRAKAAESTVTEILRALEAI